MGEPQIKTLAIRSRGFLVYLYMGTDKKNKKFEGNSLTLQWIGNDYELVIEGDLHPNEVLHRLNSVMAILAQEGTAKVYDPQKASKN